MQYYENLVSCSMQRAYKLAASIFIIIIIIIIFFFFFFLVLSDPYIMASSLSTLPALLGYLVLAVLTADFVFGTHHQLVNVSSASDGSFIFMDMQEEELSALFDVMGSLLEDPSWAQMHPQPCTETPWPGIECEIGQEDDGTSLFHITKIHIGPDILTPPPCKSSARISELSLAKLSFLKTLSIFNCFTSSPASIPSTLFTSLSYLEHLSLQCNPSLVGQIPPPPPDHAISSKLRVLCLKQNSLHGDIPKELGGLVNLEQLDLSYNNLSGQIPPQLGGLKSLSILDLSRNCLQGQLPSSLGNLRLLQKADLSSNRLHGTIPPDLISNWESLVLLDLSNNLLNGPIPSSSLSGMQNLEYLLIDDNPINTELPLSMSTLRELRTVSFSGCGLIGSVPTYFPSLRNLTALSLNSNNLSGEIPENLGSLSNLDELNLSRNQLSGEVSLPEEFIYRLGKRLDIRGNNGLCVRQINISVVLQVPECSSLITASRHRDDVYPDDKPSDSDSF
ncbi:hypothetical protein Dimus_030989 [Dionaea muscipula]